MMGSSISVECVSKCYRIGAAGVDRTLVGSLGNWLSAQKGRLSGHGTRTHAPTQFHALKDISFEVHPGETVGLIGHNGAGKSTLLKILSRITEPTRGRVRYKGRVGSLLEVGTGFHPELSGRDNILLGGTVLGMKHAEVRSKFDEIVDFAGVEQFIDVPVKRYSSGMSLRLAFAVAAHLDTDILLLDEVLAVGDLAFQKKCLQRVDNLVEEGRTVIFVSHNLTAVRSICSRAILLEGGCITDDGPVDQVIDRYSRSGIDFSNTGGFLKPIGRAANGPVNLLKVSLRPLNEADSVAIDISTSFIIEWEYQVRDRHKISPSLTCRDERGLLLFDQGNWDDPEPLEPGIVRSSCIVPGGLLNDGTYFFSLHFQTSDNQTIDFFNVLSVDLLDSPDGRHGWYGKWQGILRMRMEWKNERLGRDGPFLRAEQ